MGRFLARDTWSGNYKDPITFNLWVYANADPINFIDPTGHSVKSDVECAEGYVSSYTTGPGNVIRDEMNTYVAAGIATQCWRKGSWTAEIKKKMGKYDEYAGKGASQITDKQASEPYGKRIPDPDDPNNEQAQRGYGLRCYINLKTGCTECLSFNEVEKLTDTEKKKAEFEKNYRLEDPGDQTQPIWVVEYMRRRIQVVLDRCNENLPCDEKDRFIIAALAQNGSGFTVIHMIYIKNNYVEDNHILWGRFFKKYPFDDTTLQLRRFYVRAKLLHEHGYWLPSDILNNKQIIALKNLQYKKADEYNEN